MAAEEQVTGIELALQARAAGARIRPDMYRYVQAFNNVVVGPSVDRTAMGLNVPPRADMLLALGLVREEYEELLEACGAYINWEDHISFEGRRKLKVDHVAALDAACDIVYVLFGLMLRLGVSAELFYEAFFEVTRANMAKVGGPLREDGKRLKPEGWKEPDIAGIIERYRAATTPDPEPQP